MRLIEILAIITAIGVACILVLVAALIIRLVIRDNDEIEITCAFTGEKCRYPKSKDCSGCPIAVRELKGDGK